MSFKTFIKGKKRDLPLSNKEGETAPFYMVSLEENWINKVKRQGSKLLKKPIEPVPLDILVLGEDTIVVKNTDFEIALKKAVKYFSKKLKNFKIEELKWYRINKNTPQGSGFTPLTKTEPPANSPPPNSPP